MSHRASVVIIGGGHNGLVCAAYLAKSGFSVVLLEQKNSVGGCVVTEELSPGWMVNTYSFEHYVIQNTPIISELALENFGLRYYTVDPAVFCPFPDRKYMLLYHELGMTLKHIETLSKKDSRTYEKFHYKWSKVSKALSLGAFDGPASLEEILTKSGQFNSTCEITEIIQESSLSASSILSENFETDYVPALIAFLGPAAVGLSPSAPNTGWLCAWHLGAERLARPAGGSGELTRSIADSARAYGAKIIKGEKVVQIMVKNGKALGVKTASGKQFDAEIIVSAVDPKQTLLQLANCADFLQSEETKKIESIKVSAGFTFKADYLLSKLPNYLCRPIENDFPNECHKAATFIAPSVNALSEAYEEYSQGKNPKTPGLMVALHSSLDRSMVPPGKQSLVLETRYTPYRLNGLRWTDSDKENEAGRLLSEYAKYCPKVEDLVEDFRAMSPQDMEADVMIPQGNFMHVDMSFDQMFEKRPTSGLLNGYEVNSISNLFLCGAGTFPGGAVSGIPGRNAANQVICNVTSTA